MRPLTSAAGRAPSRPGPLSHLPLFAALGVIAAAGPLSWWAIGEQSVDGVARPDWDYTYGPFHVDPTWEYAVGGLSLALAAAGLVALVLLTAGRRVDRRWWLVTALGSGAAFAAAGSWRVMTAGVIGENIGAFALFLMAPAVVAALLAVAGSVASTTLGTRGAPRVLAMAVPILLAVALWAGLWWAL